MRAVRQIGKRGSPRSVCTLPGHRGLPNVEHQNTSGARQSCEGPKGTGALTIRHQIVEHASSHYGVERPGEGGRTQV